MSAITEKPKPVETKQQNATKDLLPNSEADASFTVPLAAKLGIVALVVIAIIIVIAIIVIKKLKNKHQNAMHDLEVAENEQETFKQQLSDQEDIINSLNARLQQSQQMSQQPRQVVIADTEGNATNVPKYEVTNQELDDGETGKTRIKEMTPQQIVRNAVNKRRQTNQDEFDKHDAEAEQQLKDAEMQQQISSMVPEYKVKNVDKLDGNQNDKKNTEIDPEVDEEAEIATTNDDDELPIQQLNKADVV